MSTNNWVQFLGVFMQVVGGFFLVFKGWQEWLSYSLKKVQDNNKRDTDISDDQVEISRLQVELSKENSLKASQVADILKNYQAVIHELDELKNSGNQKNTEILRVIDRLEKMIETQVDNFTEFLINRNK